MTTLFPTTAPSKPPFPQLIPNFPANPKSLLLHHSKSIKDIKQIHAVLIKTSSIHTPQVLENLLEASSLSIPNHLSYALKIFELSTNPHTEAYNVIIRAFNLRHSYEKSLLLFQEMVLYNVRADKYTYSCVFKSCSRYRDLKFGKMVHSHVVKFGYGLEDFVLNSMIHMYSSCGEVDIARRLFDRMSERGVVTWNAMFAGYFKAGDWEGIIDLFRKMLNLGVEFDDVTLISVLMACGRLSELELGEWIHEYVKENVPNPNQNLMTCIVDMYAKCGKVDTARKVFDEMTCRDVVAWSAMISGYNQWNRCKEALEVFNMMQVANVEPNEVTMVSVLSSCAVLGALEVGKWVHSYIKRKRLKITVNLGTALVDFYAKCGCIESALDVFIKMTLKNSWTWTVLIQAFASNGKGIEALEFFSSMLEAKLEPNDVTFVAVLSACSHAGLVKEGQHYFDSMKEMYGIDPKIEHYGCMVDLLGRAGLVEEAYNFIKRMPSKPNAIIWRTLLSACKIHKNVEFGEESLKQIMLLEPRHSGDYILLSNIYASVGRREDAIKVRNEMKEKGIKKIPGCSLMELNGSIYEFFAEDSAHPDSKAIYAKVDEIVARIKKVGYVPIVSEARLDAEEDEKEVSVSHHSEKLAIAFALIKSSPGTTIRISKNLRVCTDCHEATKLISRVYKREIIVRDRNRFHHFRDGHCSCKGYW